MVEASALMPVEVKVAELAAVSAEASAAAWVEELVGASAEALVQVSVAEWGMASAEASAGEWVAVSAV